MIKANTSKLKALRAEYDLNQEDLAKILNVTRATYQKKESRKTHFTLIEAKKIANYFNMTIEELFFAPRVDKRKYIS